MNTMRRPRFSVRVGLTASQNDGPYDDVPAHLLEPLQSWVNLALAHLGYRETEVARLICLRLRIDAGKPRTSYSGRSHYPEALVDQEGAELLDVVDALLGYPDVDVKVRPSQVEELSKLLDEGGSAYRINEDLDGLEERVTAPVRDAVTQALADAASNTSAGSAADHLASAWSAAYGRHPDPARAYSEAIKSVESAAHAVVEPNNAKATLGTMLGVIRNSPSKFTTVLFIPTGKEPITSVQAMMQALWDGQTSRHGAQTGTVPETLEAARASVHLAATVVQWFTSGAVSRKP
ncbi:hypothetical protein OH805_12180 [Streptomyces sp. NBC_00879]|uniref:hypothetical protein n=1 Tax=Streptomyces sp. NBC_00879 TaxID=2975855 RepID=UPI003864584D|nr:hypothetical protein OH805_12180 [Streptomyces sp. NBC_00879]